MEEKTVSEVLKKTVYNVQTSEVVAWHDARRPQLNEDAVKP
jgi:hypothetical protein